MFRSKLSEVLTVVSLVFCPTLLGAEAQRPGKPIVLKQEKTIGGTLVFSVRAFGAVGDGTHLDTEAIQAAIDAAMGSKS